MKAYVVVIEDDSCPDPIEIQKIFDSEEKAQAYIEANSYLVYDKLKEMDMRVPNDYKIGIFDDWIDVNMYYMEFDVE